MDKHHEGHDCPKSHDRPITLKDLERLEIIMLAAISAFTAATDASLTSIEASIAALATQGGVATALAADDQAALDTKQTRIAAAATSLAALVTTPAATTP